MRTNAERAERGRRAFEAVVHDDNDLITNLYDLVSDMLHFADTLDGAEWGFTDPDESIGSFVLRMAVRHYDAEFQEEHRPDPPEHLVDAWQRYQEGCEISQGELRLLDEWRTDVAQDRGVW